MKLTPETLGYGAFEPPEDMPGVAGIFIGGCVERGVGSSFRAQGHAHHPYAILPSRYANWICVRSPRRVFMADGRWSRLLWHEFAHVATNGHGHDHVWRAMMRTLGQPIPAQYRRASRGDKTRGLAARE